MLSNLDNKLAMQFIHENDILHSQAQTRIKTDNDDTCYWKYDSCYANNLAIMSYLKEDSGDIGSGRLFVVGDCSIWSNIDSDNDGTSNFEERDNKQLAYNIIEWLA
jgi:hypothetical protein